MNNTSDNSNLLYKVKDMASAIKLAEMSEAFSSDKLSKINTALSELTNSLYEFKEEVDYHDTELEGKIFRFVLANSSFINLLNKTPSKLSNKMFNVLDLSTINSVTRMQIESFLMIYYLSFSEGSIDEKDMRYDLYRLHGLKKQSGFSVKSKYGESKKAALEKEFDSVLSQLKSRQIFTDLNGKLRNKLLKLSHAKIIKPDILFTESGLSRFGTDELWSLYSNHTHSEYISDRQFNSNYKKLRSKSLSAQINIQFHIILTAKLCRFLIDKFESPKKVIPRIDETSRALIYTLGYKVGGNKL